MFFRRKTVRGVDYLQLVESVRSQGRSRQIVRLSLGRLDDLRRTGELHRLIENAASLSDAGVYLSPQSGRHRVQLQRDAGPVEAVLDRLLAYCGLGEAADRIARLSGAPDECRMLMAQICLGAKLRSQLSPRKLKLLSSLGATVGHEDDNRNAKAIVEQALLQRAGPLGQRAVLLCLHAGARSSGAPLSTTRGLIVATVLSDTGALLSFENWSAFWPLADVTVGLAAQLRARLGCKQVVVVGDRAVLGPRAVAAFQRSGVPHIFPIREHPFLEAAERMPIAVECHEVRPPSEVVENFQDLRYIRCLDRGSAEHDTALRLLQIARLTGNGGFYACSPGVAASARQRLEEAAAWDGASVLATNLRIAPQDVYRFYSLGRASGTWERELTRFGGVLRRAEGLPRDVDEVLAGWSVLALIGQTLRHDLLSRVAGKVGGPVPLGAVRGAILDNCRILVANGDRHVEIDPEPSALLCDIASALDLAVPLAGRSSSSTARGGRVARAVTAAAAGRLASPRGRRAVN